MHSQIVLFGGNPAAVCPLEKWLSDELMQKIATENNLSETVFFVAHTDHYEIRWFTPKVEVDLCGHATLAAAHVIFNFLNTSLNTIRFKSKSGDLIVSRESDYLTLDFPVVPATPCLANEIITQALGIHPQEIWKGADYMVVVDTEAQIRRCVPNFQLIEKLDARGLVITARGEKADFVSRWFGPQVGVNEDPVTGSAHCMLAPYWASKLNKTKLYAEQLSARLGKIYCEVTGDRVLLSGQSVLYLHGEIEVHN